MPIALRPERQTFTAHLDTDADLPDEKRPHFVCRHKSTEAWLDLQDKKPAIRQAKSNREANTLLNAFIAEWVVRPVNFPSEDLAEVLNKYLSVTEKWMLIDAIEREESLSSKKNSPSAS